MAEMQEVNSATAKDAAGLTAGDGRIERSALHEASYAVVAHRLGLDVTRACVRCDASGFVIYTACETSADTLLSFAVAALAGLTAELLLGVDPGRRFALEHGYDVLGARMTISECKAHAPNWELGGCTIARLAYCCVISGWTEIKRVAAALMACGEIDGVGVAALCGRPQ
jgi:hypothetical protein